MPDPTPIDIEAANDLESAVLAIVNESWRLASTCERLLTMIEDDDARRYRPRLAYFRGRMKQELASAGLHFSEVSSGDPYDPGMATTPINLDDFEEGDDLVVEQVIEPTIMGPEGIKRLGSVTLRKVN